ncbi:MAG: DUF1345 domain-containing protein [Nanoarchaeota archaeon]|nr:DUF1345 domain-containing protein [Nanoarchaeota archaeon]
MPERGGSKEVITIGKLAFYNLLFIAPITFCFFIATYLAGFLSVRLQTSPTIITNILMIPLTYLVFFFVVPYINARENVKGVRYALVAFLILGVFTAIPSILVRGDFSILLTQLLHIASYIVVTFIICPEVLGIDIDLQHWFKRHRQLFILLIYTSILIFYILGFAQLYHSIYLDQETAFSFSQEGTPSYGTFVYFSIVTFTTVGYGDITPTTSAARLAFSVEALLSAIINIVFIAILLVYISNSQAFQRKSVDEKIIKEEKIIEKEEREILRNQRRKKKKK